MSCFAKPAVANVSLILILLWIPMVLAAPDATPPENDTQISGDTNAIAPPPDISSIVGKEKRSLDELGYIPVSNEAVDHYSINHLKQYFSKPSDIKEKLAFDLAKLDTDITLINKGTISIPLGDSDKIYSVMRVYTLFKYTTITLEETAYVAANIRVRQAEEMVNTDINGNKGILTLRRAENGSSLILLSWITDTKILKLSIAGKNVGKERMDLALQLARSIS